MGFLLDQHDEISVRPLIGGCEKKPFSSREKYHQLKSSDLFDKDRGLWRLCSTPNGEATVTESFFTSTHILYCMVEKLFDPGQARQLYLSILFDGRMFRSRPFYLTPENRELTFISENIDDSNFTLGYEDTSLQLVWVWLQSMYDKEKARKRHQDLMKYPFFEDKSGLWYSRTPGMTNVEPPPYCAGDQLLSCLIRSQYDKEKAHAEYVFLKSSLFYDPLMQLWRDKISKPDQIGWGVKYNFTSQVQLLGIILEAVFDRESAYESYHHLKTTYLYDQERGYFNNHMHYDEKKVENNPSYLQQAPDGLNDYRFTDVQLLGIMVEHFFEDNLSSFRERITRLPFLKRYIAH